MIRGCAEATVPPARLRVLTHASPGLVAGRAARTAPVLRTRDPCFCRFAGIGPRRRWAPARGQPPGTTGQREGKTAMGTGKVQAELWGPGARDWSDYNEPMCTPFYAAVLDATGVGPGTTLLDVGCGGGFALLLAARRGATVSGIDATPALLDIAAERVPAAALTVGDLEDQLPSGGRFRRGHRVQLGAVRRGPGRGGAGMARVPARRAHRRGGLGAARAVRERGHVRGTRPAAAARPADAPGAVAWSEEGQLEELAALAGLIAVPSLTCPTR